jgi:hypothetical protein
MDKLLALRQEKVATERHVAARAIRQTGCSKSFRFLSEYHNSDFGSLSFATYRGCVCAGQALAKFQPIIDAIEKATGQGPRTDRDISCNRQAPS